MHDGMLSASGYIGSQHSPCGYPYDNIGTRVTAVANVYGRVGCASSFLCRLSKSLPVYFLLQAGRVRLSSATTTLLMCTIEP